MRNPRERATRARRVVILFACTLAIITYVQRVAISQAAPMMQEDLGLTRIQMGLVFSVFSWMYAVFEIPWGFAGDRLGARRVLTGVVARLLECPDTSSWCKVESEGHEGWLRRVEFWGVQRNEIIK